MNYLSDKGVIKGTSYVVVGFPKCGTQSLVEYLHKNGIDCLSREAWITVGQQGIEYYKKHCSQYKPIIITRNPVERAWSDYWYSIQQNKDQGLTETNRKALLERVSKDSFYDKNLVFWEKLNPIMLRFESLLQQAGFPQENQTQYKEKLDVPTINIIKEHIQKERENYLSKRKDKGNDGTDSINKEKDT